MECRQQSPRIESNEKVLYTTERRLYEVSCKVICFRDHKAALVLGW